MKHLILAIALILPLSVGAYDPDHLTLLKETNECPKCDLSGANLKGANLRGAFLMSANLDGAYLKGANTKYASMKGAILCNTTMPDGRVIYSGCPPFESK